MKQKKYVKFVAIGIPLCLPTPMRDWHKVMHVCHNSLTERLSVHSSIVLTCFIKLLLYQVIHKNIPKMILCLCNTTNHDLSSTKMSPSIIYDILKHRFFNTRPQLPILMIHSSFQRSQPSDDIQSVGNFQHEFSSRKLDSCIYIFVYLFSEAKNLQEMYLHIRSIF